jgi:hypothetical protein
MEERRLILWRKRGEAVDVIEMRTRPESWEYDLYGRVLWPPSEGEYVILCELPEVTIWRSRL